MPVDYASCRFIRTERRGRVLTLGLERPPMNTVHFELHNELSRIVYDIQVEHDADCNCVVAVTSQVVAQRNAFLCLALNQS